MLKKRLKDLNSQKFQGNSVEMINQNDLSKIKGGKLLDCPKLQTCSNNCADCPNLEHCGVNSQ